MIANETEMRTFATAYCLYFLYKGNTATKYVYYIKILKLRKFNLCKNSYSEESGFNLTIPKEKCSYTYIVIFRAMSLYNKKHALS